jgi:hypothetical protein
VHGDGPITLRQSFDAFGKRRGTAWIGVPTPGQLTTANTISRRGFTFHEHLDSTDLIHMNGRVYDPLMRGSSPQIRSCRIRSTHRASTATAT